ncbi:MAG: PAS domain-containing protein [Gammaproteobacteria bacterium]|nr:PAS domain-containing protein [Gammaproteobacteria bacterium]
MPQMHATYNPWLVTLSIVVAILVSYTALRLTERVAGAERRAGRLWVMGGAVSMGIGIWSMHFIGMLAFSVPITLRYNLPINLASLFIGMLTSLFALSISSRRDLSLRRLAASSVLMGAGICGMHYTGMAAIQIVPAITYSPVLVAASVAIAVTASFVAQRRIIWTENEIPSIKAAGLDPREHPGALLASFYPEDVAALKAALRVALAEKRETCALRVRVSAPVGATIHLQAHARLSRDESGRPRRLLGVSWDVTAIRAARSCRGTCGSSGSTSTRRIVRFAMRPPARLAAAGGCRVARRGRAHAQQAGGLPLASCRAAASGRR